VVIIRIKRGLDFPGAEYMEDKLQGLIEDGKSPAMTGCVLRFK